MSVTFTAFVISVTFIAFEKFDVVSIAHQYNLKRPLECFLSVVVSPLTASGLV